jgi:hypothetical protein
VDRPQAVLALRLCDVSPQGGSLRVSYGVLNLTHRGGHEQSEVLVPGKRYRARVVLNDAAHSFAAGHKLRIAVATSYWPIIWPSAEPVTLSLFTGVSRVTLPVRGARPEDTTLAFASAESAPPLKRSWQRRGQDYRRVTRDAGTGESVIEVLADSGRSTIDALGLETESIQRETYRIQARDPLSALVDISYTMCVGRGAWQTRTETRTVMRATKEAFLLEATLDAYEGETRILSRNWSRSVPRDGV